MQTDALQLMDVFGLVSMAIHRDFVAYFHLREQGTTNVDLLLAVDRRPCRAKEN